VIGSATAGPGKRPFLKEKPIKGEPKGSILPTISMRMIIFDRMDGTSAA
jgi:hypothetical protein